MKHIVFGIIMVFLVVGAKSQDVTSLTILPTLTTIQVSWQVNDPLNQIDKFRIIWDYGTDTVPNSETSYTIEDLSPCEQITIRVQPLDASSSIIGAEGRADASTQTELPPNVSDLESFNVTAHEINLRWKRPNTSCEIEQYNVEYEGEVLWTVNMTDFGIEFIYPSNESVIDVTFTLKDMIPFTEYLVRVTANTEAGSSSDEVIPVLTEQDNPTFVQNVTASAQGDASVVVNWAPPESWNGVHGDYTVTWYGNNLTYVSSAVTSENDYVISDTQIKTAISVGVVATNGAGNSPNAVVPIQEIECFLPFTPLRRRCVAIETIVEGTFDEMSTFCNDLGGQLVKLSSADFMADLVDAIFDQELYNHDYWVGAADDGTDGKWVWRDGTPVRLGTPYWGDFSDGIQGPLEVYTTNYAYLSRVDHFFMHDIGSNYSADASAICQQTYDSRSQDHYTLF